MVGNFETIIRGLDAHHRGKAFLPKPGASFEYVTIRDHQTSLHSTFLRIAITGVSEMKLQLIKN
jgi:hypothetical protein